MIEGMDQQCAERTGLDPETPFILGANDGVLANLGVGAVDPGDSRLLYRDQRGGAHRGGAAGGR